MDANIQEQVKRSKNKLKELYARKNEYPDWMASEQNYIDMLIRVHQGYIDVARDELGYNIK